MSFHYLHTALLSARDEDADDDVDNGDNDDDDGDEASSFCSHLTSLYIDVFIVY